MSKVSLEIRRDRGWQNPDFGVVYAKAALPFCWTRAATRVHRVRSLQLFYHLGQYTHSAVSMWCGQHGLTKNGLRLTDDLPSDLPICATCEGRAIGAGQLGAPVIAGRTVLFTPRREGT